MGLEVIVSEVIDLEIIGFTNLTLEVSEVISNLDFSVFNRLELELFDNDSTSFSETEGSCD